MERAAFARVRSFLRYHPVAMWSAIVAAVGTSIIFVGLLVLLSLFADLLINRGEILCYSDLPPRERKQFQSSPHLPDAADRKKREELIHNGLESLGVANDVSARERERLVARFLEFQWWVEMPTLLEEAVNADAGALAKQEIVKNIRTLGIEGALNQNLKDCGVLGSVVRLHSQLYGRLPEFLASTNEWMWVNGNSGYLTGLFIVGLVLALLRAGAMFAGSYMAARAAIEAVTRLRRALHHHTYRLGTLAFRALGPSEAVSVSTRHLEAVHDGLYAWLTVEFREPVKFGLVAAFALMVNFWLSVAFILFALLVWILGGQVAAYFRREGRAAALRSADQLVLLQESLMLMRLVKVYLMEQFNQTRVERQLAKYSEAQLHRYWGESIYRPLLYLFALLAAMILLLVTGIVILDGYVGVTSTLVLATSLVSLYWPLVNWLEHRRFLRRARESAVVLFKFLDRPGAVGQAVDAEFLPALSKHLEFDNVSLKEPGTGRRLLQGVSLKIEAGQRVALVGPEDMEKHALVYLIPRFLDPNSGEIKIDRKNLRWVTLDSLRAQIAIVLQHNLVFNDTVANNIGCGDPGYQLPKIMEAAKVAHAHQFIQKLPQGYETPIGEMGHSLNTSEKFRIALARAILRDPALIIIEEPVIPLDDNTKSLLDDTFTRVLPGRTVIFLPHRLSTIRNCDRIFLLYEGRIEATGDHRELLSSSELYRHLQYLEFNEFAGLLSGPSPVTTSTEEMENL
jgi:ATP-binding cassette subfamily B protein